MAPPRAPGHPPDGRDHNAATIGPDVFPGEMASRVLT